MKCDKTAPLVCQLKQGIQTQSLIKFQVNCDKAGDNQFGDGAWKCFLSNDTLEKNCWPHPQNVRGVFDYILRTELLGVRIPAKVRDFCILGSAAHTHLISWYRACFSSVAKIPTSHLLSTGKSILVLICINFISNTRRPSVLEDAVVSGEFIFLNFRSILFQLYVCCLF